jgi:3-hydroxy acid dehydrogenase / malonic semialdehyde reductase
MKVIISGSSSGIGRALTLKLLEQGYQVIGLARNHRKFNPENPRYQTYDIDFSDLKAAEIILKQIYAQHSSVDAIISNAGYGRFGALEQFSITQICDLMNVNFTSQVLLIKTFLPAFKRRKAGKIILMGSESALAGAKQGSIYCASKFALRGFAQSLRAECRSAGIAVTLINPGLVNTPFFDGLHFTPGSAAENAIQPEDVAQTIAHLLQLENHYLIEEINLQPMQPTIEFTKSENHF